MLKSAKKQPAAMDIHVGTRVRVRRTMLGMSQEKLGEHIGVTFQQVQKYEKGTNRVGASRLQQIGKALSVSPAWFFEDADQSGIETPAPAEDSVLAFISSREGVELNRAFSALDATARRHLLGVIKTVAALTTAPAENGGEQP